MDPKMRFRTLRIFSDIFFFNFWTVKALENCKQNQKELKIAKKVEWIFHSFQNNAHHFGPKKRLFLMGGRGSAYR